MTRNEFWTWWEQYSGYVLGPFLVFLALLINRFVRPYWATHFVDDLIVALLIAGILAVTVDPFIKKRARREATRDIFHHMLGYSLPSAIRERLSQTIEQTKLYRRNLIETIDIQEVGDSLVFNTDVEFEVFNPSSHSLTFLPHLEFEISEKPKVKCLICFDESDCQENLALSPMPNGMGYECKGKEVVIPSGESKRFKYEYSVQYPTALGFYYPHFKYPTIGLSLTIKAPENFKITASAAEQEAKGNWRYPNRLFMPGEQFGIVWEKLSRRSQGPEDGVNS